MSKRSSNLPLLQEKKSNEVEELKINKILNIFCFLSIISKFEFFECD